MSRLNYLTDEELALDGIDQELRLLERLVADGLQLDAIHLQTLADCRDRVSQLIAPWSNATPAGKDHAQTVELRSSRASQTVEPSIEDPSIEKLRQSIQKLLDKAMA